jgi:hypothetical protein
MSYHGTSEEKSQDIGTPVVFQTVEAVIRLEDHLGKPLDGGKVLQGIGGWPQIGVTGDGGPGEVHYEMLPGAHKFKMRYAGTSQEKIQDISTPVVFKIILIPTNRPPNAEADGPYYLDEGSAVQLDASGSSDPDGDVLDYWWDFDNDSVWDLGPLSASKVYHSWYDNGNFVTVVLKVTDGEL